MLWFGIQFNKSSYKRNWIRTILYPSYRLFGYSFIRLICYSFMRINSFIYSCSFIRLFVFVYSSIRISCPIRNGFDCTLSLLLFEIEDVLRERYYLYIWLIVKNSCKGSVQILVPSVNQTPITLTRLLLLKRSGNEPCKSGSTKIRNVPINK